LNEYRHVAGVRPVTLDADNSLNNRLHARFLVANDRQGTRRTPTFPTTRPKVTRLGGAATSPLPPQRESTGPTTLSTPSRARPSTSATCSTRTRPGPASMLTRRSATARRHVTARSP